MRQIQKSKFLTKSEVFLLSGSGNVDTVKNKPLMNAIAHGTHHPVSVCDIYNVMAICKDGTGKFKREGRISTFLPLPSGQ